MVLQMGDICKGLELQQIGHVSKRASRLFCIIYRRNQSGCEKANKMGFLPSILWVFLNIFVALMKITMCFKQLEASHNIS